METKETTPNAEKPQTVNKSYLYEEVNRIFKDKRRALGTVGSDLRALYRGDLERIREKSLSEIAALKADFSKALGETHAEQDKLNGYTSGTDIGRVRDPGRYVDSMCRMSECNARRWQLKQELHRSRSEVYARNAEAVKAAGETYKQKIMGVYKDLGLCTEHREKWLAIIREARAEMLPAIAVQVDQLAKDIAATIKKPEL